MSNFDEELIFKYLPLDKQAQALKKLKEGYPVQYLIGNVDFCGYIIDVNENVLIPRFETEYLVEYLLFYIRRYEYINPKILDVGTGSGCISIAIKKQTKCEIDAIDISNKALQIAKNNAIKNDVNINFINEDIEKFQNNSRYNILVSNPPYIGRTEEVDIKTKYEPQNALFAKNHGLYFYDVILLKAKSLLTKRNIIAFEIGKDQANYIKNKALNIFPKAEVKVLQDLNGFDRYIFIVNE